MFDKFRGKRKSVAENPDQLTTGMRIVSASANSICVVQEGVPGEFSEQLEELGRLCEASRAVLEEVDLQDTYDVESATATLRKIGEVLVRLENERASSTSSL